jgi:hypothetical protein
LAGAFAESKRSNVNDIPACHLPSDHFQHKEQTRLQIFSGDGPEGLTSLTVIGSDPTLGSNAAARGERGASYMHSHFIETPFLNSAAPSQTP